MKMDSFMTSKKLKAGSFSSDEDDGEILGGQEAGEEAQNQEEQNQVPDSEVDVVQDPLQELRNRLLNAHKGIELNRLPKMIVPESLNSGHWRDILWPLQPEGVADAHDFLKTVGDSRRSITHFCVACFEADSNPMKDCFFCFGGVNAPNASKHFLKHKKGALHYPGFTFKKITDLAGRKCATSSAEQKVNKDGTLGIAEPPGIKADVDDAAAKWIAATGLPLNTTEHPFFRELMKVASRVQNPTDLNVGSQAIKTRIINMAHGRRKVVLDELQDLQHAAFVVFDGWDGKVKVVNFSLFYVSKARPQKLRLEAFPVSLSFAKLDEEMETITSEKDIVKLLDEALEDIGLTRDILAGGKSDNAVRAAIASINLGAAEQHDPIKYSDWADFNKQSFIGCIAHILNLLVIYACGDKKAARDSTIPQGPSHPGVTDAIATAEKANAWLTNEKNFQRASSVARDRYLKLLQPVMPDTTRWNSMYNCLKRALDNFPVLRHCKINGHPVLSEKTARILAEFEGILEPLARTQKLLQTTSRPIGPTILPLIRTLLNRYAIPAPNGIIATMLHPDHELLKQTAFAVRYPGTTALVGVQVSKLSPESYDLVKTIQNHLIFRLVTQRQNTFMWEVVGMFIDPYMRHYARKVCGEDPESEWNYEKAGAKVGRVLQAFRKDSKGESSPVQVAEPTLPSSHFNFADLEPSIDDSYAAPACLGGDGEFGRWLSDSETNFLARSPQEIVFKFAGFCETFDKYDPLSFWSSSNLQVKYPTIFAANLVSLAYQPTSTYCESVFSTASMTLSKKRNRIYQNPLLASAVVTLRHSFASETAKARTNEDCGPDEL